MTEIRDSDKRMLGGSECIVTQRKFFILFTLKAPIQKKITQYRSALPGKYSTRNTSVVV